MFPYETPAVKPVNGKGKQKVWSVPLFLISRAVGYCHKVSKYTELVVKLIHTWEDCAGNQSNSFTSRILRDFNKIT
jgi:hypothetical protein